MICAKIVEESRVINVISVRESNLMCIKSRTANIWELYSNTQRNTLWVNPDSLDLVTPEGFGSHIQYSTYSTSILVSSSVTILPSLVFFKKYFSLKNFYLFIWLRQVLVTACRILFSCDMWELVPWQGSKPGLLHWEHGVLATGPLDHFRKSPKNISKRASWTSKVSF